MAGPETPWTKLLKEEKETHVRVMENLIQHVRLEVSHFLKAQEKERRIIWLNQYPVMPVPNKQLLKRRLRPGPKSAFISKKPRPSSASCLCEPTDPEVSADDESEGSLSGRERHCRACPGSSHGGWPQAEPRRVSREPTDPEVSADDESEGSSSGRERHCRACPGSSHGGWPQAEPGRVCTPHERLYREDDWEDHRLTEAQKEEKGPTREEYANDDQVKKNLWGPRFLRALFACARADGLSRW